MNQRPGTDRLARRRVFPTDAAGGVYSASVATLVAIASLLAIATMAAAASSPTAEPSSQQMSQRSAEEIQALAERYQAAGVPGPEHERLAAMAGAWDIEITMWPQRDADPMTITGTMRAETILGGRFLVQTSDISDFGPDGGMMSILGFDRRADEYTLIGMDTTGTYWVSAQGAADESGRRAVLSGEDYNPIFDHLQIYDFVLEWPDDDTFRTQIIFKDEAHTGGGPPFTMVKTVSRRRR